MSDRNINEYVEAVEGLLERNGSLERRNAILRRALLGVIDLSETYRAQLLDGRDDAHLASLTLLAREALDETQETSA